MDFFTISTREAKGGVLEIYPDFTVGRSKDLMVRGRSFYAIWDEAKGLWSTDEYDVQRLVDEALAAHAEGQKAKGISCSVKYLRSFTSNGWKQFQTFLKNVSDNHHPLDESLTFSNTPVKKTDYVSRRLSYPLEPGDHSAWDELVGTLYSEEERAKIEWAIGAIVSGDSKKLQKFLVFYGPGGTGKSTILNIIQKLFDGYVATFEAKALVGNNNGFSTEVFKNNPLIAIQHDGDLSKIEDNTKLNSIVSHEKMTVNEKYKSSYEMVIQAFLLMGTNKPVKISDAKSGLIRRLIDVHPTGTRLQPNHYHTLMGRIDFELGAIAYHCLEVYRSMGKNAYNTYRPVEMMLQTDVFYNFIEANFDIFKAQDGASLKQGYALYKEFNQETGVDWTLPQYKFRTEFQNYFEEFHERFTVGENTYRSYYKGFKAQPFKSKVGDKEVAYSLVLDETVSLLDLELADQPAQYGKEDENGRLIPAKRWATVKTTLSELGTRELHYVKVPPPHIVIDFDLKDGDGRKSLDRNLEEASKWPPTYAELSQGGNGVHLHYYFDGPVEELANVYMDGVEIKVFTGDGSLRRRLSKCNNVPIATISSGLPFREKKVLNTDTIKSEKGLRSMIARNLRKEIHPGTKPSIDFIQKILDDAFLSGMQYNVSDMMPDVIAFAAMSTNQKDVCLKTVTKMKFKSNDSINDAALPWETPPEEKTDAPLTFYDVEVYPNLFIICWKYRGKNKSVVKMINPSAQEVEALFKMKLIGFNNRRYDNHILYAAYLGYNNEQLYNLSQKIVNGNVGAMFGEAYNISYTDIYDFSSKKQGLKKFQIELGLPHREMDLPWDQPVPPELWEKVADYCTNDVITTEATFEARYQDFVARQILAELSGLSVNDTTQKHTARIIFGGDRNPQSSFVYTDLRKDFPGYEFDRGKSTYRGEEVGEGGLVRAKPGMYKNVALLDVASMHPTSIEQLNLFGEYTPRFSALKAARIAIKHKDYETAKQMLDGRLAPFLQNPEDAKALSDALKIVINIVYGLTSAKFDNAFRDVRNKDNIVAKRGALFMLDLKHYVEEQGFTVAHIKTDSIKIPDATPEIIDAVMKFGEKYGYTFEHEATYDQFCLVNDAVYIARQDICNAPVWKVVDESQDEEAYVSNVEGSDCVTKWTAVGAQFQHPYVFKTLFSGEEVGFEDLCETKQVTQGAIYLDFDQVKPMALTEPQAKMQFIGRTGRFVPVREGFGGGVLYRIKDGKAYAVTGTKGYLWVEAALAKDLPLDAIDMEYFDSLANEARNAIDFYGPFVEFVA